MCAVVFLLLVLTPTFALPSWPDLHGPSGRKTECDTNDATQTLCQRCAKQTKSNIVYPMCCDDLEEARDWCFHYVTFGIQGE